MFCFVTHDCLKFIIFLHTFPTRGLQVFATMSAHVLDFQNLELLNEVLERRQTEKKEKERKEASECTSENASIKGEGFNLISSLYDSSPLGL